MNQTILTLRIFFVLLCATGSLLISYTVAEWWNDPWMRATSLFVGTSIGVLVILVDILLKGFSLRGLSALTFGLFIGWAAAQLLSSSPFFDVPDSARGDEVELLLAQNIYITRLAIFVILMYLGAVIALRGKDEFNLVIPYVRFVPHGVDVPLAVVDTSALIDGRIVGICESKFMSYGLIVPQFVIDELHRVADSADSHRRALGRKGLSSLKRLREMEFLDLRISESQVDKRQSVDTKLVFLAKSMRARLLTTDYNLAQVAEFHNVEWLNLNALSRSLNYEVVVGQEIEVELVKPGRESGQAVGYLPDGSMVVVAGSSELIGRSVIAEVKSVLPSAGGRMVFAELVKDNGQGRKAARLEAETSAQSE